MGNNIGFKVWIEKADVEINGQFLGKAKQASPGNISEQSRASLPVLV